MSDPYRETGSSANADMRRALVEHHRRSASRQAIQRNSAIGLTFGMMLATMAIWASLRQLAVQIDQIVLDKATIERLSAEWAGKPADAPKSTWYLDECTRVDSPCRTVGEIAARRFSLGKGGKPAGSWMAVPLYAVDGPNP